MVFIFQSFWSRSRNQRLLDVGDEFKNFRYLELKPEPEIEFMFRLQPCLKPKVKCPAMLSLKNVGRKCWSLKKFGHPYVKGFKYLAPYSYAVNCQV